MPVQKVREELVGALVFSQVKALLRVGSLIERLCMQVSLCVCL